MIKLIVTDMDGTFLNSDSGFNYKRFENLKNKLEEKKIKLAFVTGKQCERVEAIVGKLANNTFIVGDSATRIRYNQQNIFEETIPNQLGLKIIEAIKMIDDEQTIIACTPNTAYVQNDILVDEKKYVHGSYENVTYINNFKDVSENFLKITIHDYKGNCRGNVMHLKKSFDEQVYMVASEEWWIDITTKGVHKGSTVNYLQELLSISKEETIAFGDGLNDIELFEISRFKVAMDNAYEELKEKANLIAISNDRDGVLETLELLI